MEKSKAGRTPFRVGLVLFGLAFVLGIVGGVRLTQIVTSTVNGPTFDASAPISVELEPGDHSVYELSGSTSSAGPVRTSRSSSTTISPSDVSVTGPGGQSVSVRGSGIASETLTSGSDTYRAVAKFDVTTAGTHTVDIEDSDAQVKVAPSVSAMFGRMAPWIIMLVVAGILGLVGFILFVVGLVKKGKAKRPSGPTGPSYPGGPGGGYPGGPQGYPGQQAPGQYPPGGGYPGQGPGYPPGGGYPQPNQPAPGGYPGQPGPGGQPGQPAPGGYPPPSQPAPGGFPPPGQPPSQPWG